MHASMSGFFTVSARASLRRHTAAYPYELYLVNNHGVPEDVIHRAFTAVQEFFSLPDEKKLEVDNKKTANFKGYNAVLTSNNDPAGAGDMHEGFEFGWEEIIPKDSDEKRTNDGVMVGGNIWPSGLPEFREAVLTY